MGTTTRTTVPAVGGRLACALAFAASVYLGAPPAAAEVFEPEPLVPPLPDLSDYVKNEKWAKILGKALFWEQRVGSDGMACASCHFSAGADSRIANQLNPGERALPVGDTQFGAVGDYDGEPLPGAPIGKTASGADPDSGYTLTPDDFPFHQLEDITDRNSPILITTNDSASSSGSFQTQFRRLAHQGGKSYHGKGDSDLDDKCTKPSADVFQVRDLAARMVEPRNTPTTINAVFNVLNFWDGRANDQFNGVGVFGPRDIAANPRAKIVVSGRHGRPYAKSILIDDASLASQSAAPPLSQSEMSCDGRTFPDVGRKVLGLRALADQKVHSRDSMFGYGGPYGDLRADRGHGLEKRYMELVMRAFKPELWKSKGKFLINDQGKLYRSKHGYTQAELNFSLFWGLSILLYESTLISNHSPFDFWLAGDVTALDEDELAGMALFNNFVVTGCFTCHNVAERLFTEAGREAGHQFLPPERSAMNNGVEGMHDRGFFNIGTRPSSFDPGIGGVDDYGNPLSLARMWLKEQDGSAVVDPVQIDACAYNFTNGLIEGGTDAFGPPGAQGNDATDPPCDAIDPAQHREIVDGGMKTPTLRNVGITPPYFHYGGYKSLKDVMEFYNRGGSFRDKSLANGANSGDTSGTGPLGKGPIPVSGPEYGTNVDRFVRPLGGLAGGQGLSEEQLDQIVAFMLSLTDPRVQCDAAPFDHPSLTIPNGVKRWDGWDRDGVAEEIMVTIPASGAGGYEADGKPHLCLPNTGDLFDPDLRNRLIPVDDHDDHDGHHDHHGHNRPWVNKDDHDHDKGHDHDYDKGHDHDYD